MGGFSQRPPNAHGTRTSGAWKREVNLRSFWLSKCGCSRPLGGRSKHFRGLLHQEGTSLNAAGINYAMLMQAEAMKRLKELETLAAPTN